MTQKPRRRRDREDRSEWPLSQMLPPHNWPAGRAYICALIGLVPGLGLVLGPLAVGLGWIGFRRSQRVPSARGVGHAVVSMVLGALEIVVNIIGWGMIAVGLELI